VPYADTASVAIVSISSPSKRATVLGSLTMLSQWRSLSLTTITSYLVLKQKFIIIIMIIIMMLLYDLYKTFDLILKFRLELKNFEFLIKKIFILCFKYLWMGKAYNMALSY
jgi:hypothetical protein